MEHFHLRRFFLLESGRISLIELRLVLLLVPLAHQNVPESRPEGLVAQGVAHRVDCAVHVTQPIAQCPKRSRYAVLAEGVHQNHDVVRQPCCDEDKQNGTECLRCFLVICLLFVLALADFALCFGGEALRHRGVLHVHGPRRRLVGGRL